MPVEGSAGEGELVLGVMAGVSEASAASSCPVVGGDVSSSSELVAAVTVIGTVTGGASAPGPVSRAGAEAGDALFVTGPCGGSAADLRNRGGLRYCRPMARLAEGKAAREAGARAMIDVSDGLALDLHRLADASGVGFRLDTVQVAEGATVEEAVGGGEDYELIIAIAEEDVNRMESAFVVAGLRAPLRIGSVSGDPAERQLEGRTLDRVGWQHRLG